MACRKATSRPFLDGKLDDPQWQGSFRSLRGGKAEEQAQFAFAYDSEFLYLAAICPSPDSVAVEPLATRTRDSASPKGIELAGTSTSTAIIPPAIGWWWTKPEEFPMPAGSIKAGIRAGL